MKTNKKQNGTPLHFSFVLCSYCSTFFVVFRQQQKRDTVISPRHRYMPDFHTLHGLLGQSSSGGGPLPGGAGGFDGGNDGDSLATGQLFSGRSISIGGESGERLWQGSAFSGHVFTSLRRTTVVNPAPLPPYTGRGPFRHCSYDYGMHGND